MGRFQYGAVRVVPRVEYAQVHEHAHGTAVRGQPPEHRVRAVAVAGRERDHVAAGPDGVVRPAPRRALGLAQRLPRARRAAGPRPRAAPMQRARTARRPARRGSRWPSRHSARARPAPSGPAGRRRPAAARRPSADRAHRDRRRAAAPESGGKARAGRAGRRVVRVAGHHTAFRQLQVTEFLMDHGDRSGNTRPGSAVTANTGRVEPHAPTEPSRQHAVNVTAARTHDKTRWCRREQGKGPAHGCRRCR